MSSPFVFVALAVIGCRLSSDCPYAYGYGLISAPKQNETQIAEQMIEDNFTSKNMLALIVPTGDYDKESAILDELEPVRRGRLHDGSYQHRGARRLHAGRQADAAPVRRARGSRLRGRAGRLRAPMPPSRRNYGKIVGNLSTYKVPLIDMFLFRLRSGGRRAIVTLSDEQTKHAARRRGHR